VSAVQPGSVQSGDLAAGAIGSSDLPAGSVIQVVQGVNTTQTDITTQSVYTSIMSASITPFFDSSKILVLCNINMYMQNGPGEGSYRYRHRIIRNSLEIMNGGLNYMYAGVTSGNFHELTVPGVLNFLDSPSTTSSTSYEFEVYPQDISGILRVNFSGGASTITLMEIAG